MKGAALGYGYAIAFGTIFSVLYFAVACFIIWCMVNIIWPPRDKIISWPVFLTATILYLPLALLVVPQSRFWPYLYEQDNFERLLAYSLLMLAAGPVLYLVAVAARSLPRPLVQTQD